MTGRLTRAHRRKLESKTHQKIDLDHLAEIDVKKIEAKLPLNEETETPVVEIAQKEEAAAEEAAAAEGESASKEEESASKEEKSASKEEESASEEDSESEEDDSEEESDSSSSDDDDNDDDLDSLLEKAEKALKIQSNDIQLENTQKPFSKKISKMDIGITDKELYLKTHTGRSKLVTEAVELLAPGEKASRKASVVLTSNKDDDNKKLTKKERLIEREKTAGSAWFDMPKPEITPEIKRDLQVLKMRHILDRKRHYKKMGNRPDPKYFQIGTIIESPTEFYSARLNKKDRKQTIVEELMANDDQKSYYKRKYNEVQDRTNSGGKKHFKKLKAQRQWAK